MPIAIAGRAEDVLNVISGAEEALNGKDKAVQDEALLKLTTLLEAAARANGQVH
jgi:hypothetical protein